MFDGPQQIQTAPLTPLSWEQMVFLEQRLYIPWDLLVDLFADERISIAGGELVITTNDSVEILPFHFSGPRIWNAEIGGDQITFRASLDAIREAA
jgi:hypothetical protein